MQYIIMSNVKQHDRKYFPNTKQFGKRQFRNVIKFNAQIFVKCHGCNIFYLPVANNFISIVRMRISDITCCSVAGRTRLATINEYNLHHDYVFITQHDDKN